MSALLLLVFFRQAGNGMVWSIIAVYGHSMGASAAVIGLMISCYGGARLLVNFPAGYASERFGRRRMMSFSNIVLALASFGIVLTTDLPAFFVGLLLMGLASSIYITSALAAVVDLGTPGKRVNDMALYQACNMAGVSMGPALGGLTAGLFGYDAPFFFNGIVALVNIVAFYLMPWSEPHDKSEVAAPTTRVEMARFARKGAAIWLMVFTLFFVRVSANSILMPIIVQERFGLDLATIGLMLTSGAVANFCGVPVAAGLASRFGRRGVILLASLVPVVAVGLMIFGTAPAFFWGSAILFGFSGGIAAPMLTSYVADMAPADQRGPAMGIFRTMQDLALLVGPFLTGLLSDQLGFGFQGGLVGCLLLMVLSTVAFRLTARDV